LKLLLDTNIVLDLLMDRTPFAESAAELFSMVEDGTVTGCLCATTITTLFYLTAKTVGPKQAQREVKKLLQLFEVAPVNRAVLESAVNAGFVDFEDAVICQSACHAGAEAIITRNLKDFAKSRIPVYTAEEVIQIVTSRIPD